MPRHDDDESLETYLELLRALPFVRQATATAIATSRDRVGDADLQLELTDGSRETLVIEAKSSHLRRGQATHIQAQMGDEPWLLAVPHVGAPLGAELEAQGIQFIDRQGNCFVRIGDRFCARVQGRPPPKAPPRAKEIRAAGYQVMFALLVEPELVGAPQRAIAEMAGTSRQPVIDLLARWEAERFVVKSGRRYAWVEPPGAELLDRWIAGYLATLRAKLEVGRFRTPAQGPREMESLLEEHVPAVRYGGTAGGYRLAGHYRGPTTTAHLGAPSASLRRKLRAVPDPEGELIWMRDIGEASAQSPEAATVNPLLVYAELVDDPDPRAGELAAMVREEWLPWST